MSWDGQKPPVVLEKSHESNNWDHVPVDYEVSGASSRLKFREFFRNYRVGNVYHYREALLRQWTQGLYFIEVDLGHIFEYDDILLNSLQVSEYFSLYFHSLRCLLCGVVIHRLDQMNIFLSSKLEQKMH